MLLPFLRQEVVIEPRFDRLAIFLSEVGTAFLCPCRAGWVSPPSVLAL